MIIGLGIDITDQKRIEESIAQFGDSFLQRILTETEIAACARYRFPVEHYAGKFAVKEAFMKAIGTGLKQVTFHEIEVLNRESGAPYLVTSGKAQQFLKALEVTQVHVSISHDAHLAVAVVVVEKLTSESDSLSYPSRD
jgi:holo-[acyl-carrier protein] synthase